VGIGIEELLSVPMRAHSSSSWDARLWKWRRWPACWWSSRGRVIMELDSWGDRAMNGEAFDCLRR